MKRRTWGALGLLLVLSLALAGCGQKITAEEIVAKMQETVQTTEDAHAIVEASISVQGMEISATVEVWEQAPNKLRVEVIEASEARFADTVIVTDGEQAWSYEPQRNLVQVGPPGEVDMPLPQEILGSLQGTIQEMLDASDVELAGEEQVAGRPAYVLNVSAKEDAEQEIFPGNGTATVWVDKEQWFILRATYEASAFGQGTMEVRSFELNSGLSDELFEFEVPEGARVIDAQAQQPEPLTLVEAVSQAGFHLLIPGYVPQDATLVDIFRVGESYVLRYNHSTQVSFTVIQGPELASPPPLGDLQGLTVRGQSATAISDEAGGNTFLYWTEDGITVTVAGHISLDEALKVAESLK
jgi:outer membrane lipoprotein-sorting protein